MRNKKKFYSQSQNKNFISKLKRFFLVIVLIFLFFSLTKNIFDYKKTINFYNSFKNEYEQEKKRKIELRTKILKSKDPYEVEKIISNKLGLLKQDEIVIIIPNPTPTPKINKPKELPIYRQWIETLF